MSGLKAWATETASNGAEDARKMCGGHGYMLISGLPDIVASAMATFEGENWVMWQQVAIYLMKGLSSHELPPGMSYLNKYRFCSNPRPCFERGTGFLFHDVLLRIFEHRAARLIFEAHELLSHSNLSKSAAWNKNMMSLISAARAHIETHILANFIDQVSSIPSSPVHDVLSKLTSLHALTNIAAPNSVDAISFFADGHLSNVQLSDIREQIDTLLEQLLPDAIALTDAFNFTDASLCSAIGMKHGNAYKRVLEWTRQLPLNISTSKNGGVFKEGFEKYIQPLICVKL